MHSNSLKNAMPLQICSRYQQLMRSQPVCVRLYACACQSLLASAVLCTACLPLLSACACQAVHRSTSPILAAGNAAALQATGATALRPGPGAGVQLGHVRGLATFSGPLRQQEQGQEAAEGLGLLAKEGEGEGVVSEGEEGEEGVEEMARGILGSSFPLPLGSRDSQRIVALMPSIKRQVPGTYVFPLWPTSPLCGPESSLYPNSSTLNPKPSASLDKCQVLMHSPSAPQPRFVRAVQPIAALLLSVKQCRKASPAGTRYCPGTAEALPGQWTGQAPAHCTGLVTWTLQGSPVLQPANRSTNYAAKPMKLVP